MRETYGNDTEDLGMEVDTCAGIPRYPAGNKTDGNDDNTDPAVETTIHDRIARSLFATYHMPSRDQVVQPSLKDTTAKLILAISSKSNIPPKPTTILRLPSRASKFSREP